MVLNKTRFTFLNMQSTIIKNEAAAVYLSLCTDMLSHIKHPLLSL